MGKPEGTVENYLIRQSEKHNCMCFKFVSPGRRGVPDRIVIGYGQTFFIELKSDNGILSEQQKLTIKHMKEHGADVRVLASRTEIDQFFHTLEKQKGTQPCSL